MFGSSLLSNLFSYLGKEPLAGIKNQKIHFSKPKKKK